MLLVFLPNEILEAILIPNTTLPTTACAAVACQAFRKVHERRKELLMKNIATAWQPAQWSPKPVKWHNDAEFTIRMDPFTKISVEFRNQLVVCRKSSLFGWNWVTKEWTFHPTTEQEGEHFQLSGMTQYTRGIEDMLSLIMK